METNQTETIQTKTLQNATGKIDYPLTNDYMFRAVLQKNTRVLKGLSAALLHLRAEDILSADILNSIELGESLNARTFVLDVKVLLNNSIVINLEMQVINQAFWKDRSLSYLCSIFSNLEKGDNFSQVMPAYHIGIVDFSPFPDYPEFYATHKMMNVKKHYIYNDKFTLNVLDLNRIELATDEDKAYQIDYWARLFKAKTWEDLKMIAQRNEIFRETCDAVFTLNQDDKVRYWCEAVEEGKRIERTYQAEIAEKNNTIETVTEERDAAISVIAEQKTAIAERDSTIAEKDSVIAEQKTAIAEKDSAMAEKDSLIAEKDAIIARLMAEMEKSGK